MARTEGALNADTISFQLQVQRLVDQGYDDPALVVAKLTKHRNPKIRLQAAKCLLEYTYAKRVMVRVEEAVAPQQMTMTWEEYDDKPPDAPIDITNYEVIDDE